MAYFRSGDAIKYIPGSLGLKDRTYIGGLFMPRRRRTSLEGITERIKMRFLRDKRSNEMNARCHVELFVSPFSYLCLSFLHPTLFRLFRLFFSLFCLKSPFSSPSFSRNPHAVVARGTTWTTPRVVHRTLLRPLDK